MTRQRLLRALLLLGACRAAREWIRDCPKEMSLEQIWYAMPDVSCGGMVGCGSWYCAYRYCAYNDCMPGTQWQHWIIQTTGDTGGVDHWLSSLYQDQSVVDRRYRYQNVDLGLLFAKLQDKLLQIKLDDRW